MPVYSTRRFAAFALSSLVIGIVVLSFVGWGVLSLFSGGLATVYRQYVDPYSSGDSQAGKRQPQIWASINHTIVILEPNVIESILTVKALEAPGISNQTIGLSLDPNAYTMDDPLPEVLDGNLSWHGIFGVDLHVNDTVTLWTKLRFNSDAMYFVGGWVLGYSPSSQEGYGTKYYIYVEQGKIVKVTDHREIPTSTRMDLEPH